MSGACRALEIENSYCDIYLGESLCVSKNLLRAVYCSKEGVMPFRIGPWEIGLILIIILIVFGVGKLPQVGGAIGKGMRAFRRGQQGEGEEEEEVKPKKKTTRKTV